MATSPVQFASYIPQRMDMDSEQLKSSHISLVTTENVNSTPEVSIDRVMAAAGNIIFIAMALEDVESKLADQNSRINYNLAA